MEWVCFSEKLVSAHESARLHNLEQSRHLEIANAFVLFAAQYVNLSFIKFCMQETVSI
jgi:hypothetical protein